MAETDFAISQRRWRENCTLKTRINDLKRQLEEAREENDKLYTENLAITGFYTDLCDRLPKGSCEILGHGWHNVEKYIKRRHDAITFKKLKEKGDE